MVATAFFRRALRIQPLENRRLLAANTTLLPEFDIAAEVAEFDSLAGDELNDEEEEESEDVEGGVEETEEQDGLENDEPDGESGSLLHNHDLPNDVNDDGVITALDALVVINELARQGADRSNTEADNNGLFFDVNADNVVSALDALFVINGLQRDTAEGERIHLDSPSVAPMTELHVATSASQVPASQSSATDAVFASRDEALLAQQLQATIDLLSRSNAG